MSVSVHLYINFHEHFLSLEAVYDVCVLVHVHVCVCQLGALGCVGRVG